MGERATTRNAVSPGEGWFQNAIFYEAPVKSFFDASGDGVGDLRGLTQKLDYIHDLGATCIWLLPFFPSPLHDDGYDVTDYRAVHPAYGTIDDFRAFVGQAHRRGLRVAAEMVINHTSDEHPWFQAARDAPPGTPLRDFYVWSDTPERFAVAQGLPTDGQPSNWTWDPVAKAYYWHRFSRHQPDLNYENPAVRAEMLKVLRFWAELGVDGLCLNGAAYLGKREGTRCEHLPETHALLQEFRRQLVAAYPHVMIQAGVNSWPADAATYFGDGAECHMAPNLALTPRMFLALRQEDHQALIDILRQTPKQPQGCQWVTLLRNHDELTLSLATDEERDYLFREYAAAASMRLRQGILRRLAPLVENSRRRMELLFGLLFALKGSPVIYYGDELGMGDNVFSGDRSGVRTPMQWNADRNAGFSQADFAALYAPPVMDPVFGYQRVNVEAQQRDSSSFLHWMRRLIALRKRHPALSWGDLELLEPENRKAVAWIRTSPTSAAPVRQQGANALDETILVVANLSRLSQPVELDLSKYAGLVPVEMFGRIPFPRIGSAPYLITLGPHASFWFQLQKTVEPPVTRLADVETEQAEQVPVLRWNGQDEELFAGEARTALERSVLAGHLKSQRWFGGKARQIESLRIADGGSFPAAGAKAFLVLLEITFASGEQDLYFFPWTIRRGAAAVQAYQSLRPWVVARLEGPEHQGILLDGVADDEFCSSLLSAIGDGQEFAMGTGTVCAQPCAAYADLRGSKEYPLTVIRGPATSSNSLVFYGRRLLLKLFRRLEIGVNPDFEVGCFLTQEHHFDRTPSVAGRLEYRSSQRGGPFTLALLQARVPNQGDGWSHAIDELGRYYDRASARMFSPDPLPPDTRPLAELAAAVPPPAALETIAGYLHAATTLGRRTAEMHLALASDATLADFAPEPLTHADLEALRHDVRRQGRQALATLGTQLDRLPAALAPQARRLVKRGPEAIRRLTARWISVPSAAKTRIHGDYHLGQVLWVDNDYVILDFEGEPTRSVAERRAKFSALRDVAGMLRSYHYAAYAGLFAFTRDRPDDLPRLAPWAELWQQWVSAAFLAAYLRTAEAAAAVFLPAERREFAFLLDGFMLGKALYELIYELNNRPDWVRIPLTGVLRLLQSEVDAVGAESKHQELAS